MEIDTKQIWTIGHSSRTLEEFTAMLKSFSIKQLVDVRSLPGSNKFPHFNQDELAASLNKIGIGYYHFKNLGGRRRPAKDSTNTVWHNKSFRAYADYMETTEFKKSMGALEKLARGKPTAIMCSEAVWWRCHRAMISDKLKSEEWKVWHIMAPEKETEHPYTQPAEIVHGRLQYGRKSGQ